jgi:hypothetical protein
LPGGDLELELEPLYTATSDMSAWLPSIVLEELRLEFFASISVAADGKVDEEGDDRLADAFSGVTCAATVPTADTIDGGLAPRISGFGLYSFPPGAVEMSGGGVTEGWLTTLDGSASPPAFADL